MGVVTIKKSEPLRLDDYRRMYRRVEGNGPNRLQLAIFLAGFALAAFVALLALNKDVQTLGPVPQFAFTVAWVALGLAAVLFLVATLMCIDSVSKASDLQTYHRDIGEALKDDQFDPEKVKDPTNPRRTAGSQLQLAYTLYHQSNKLIILGVALSIISLAAAGSYVLPPWGTVIVGSAAIVALAAWLNWRRAA